jgi:uncharacterized protein (TIGR04255 family)
MSDLPSFTSPPIAEVVIGAQLAQSWISGPVLGSLWDELRVEYPIYSSQPPLQPINERFDGANVMQLQFGSAGVREVLTSGDGARIAQIQSDRVAFNWRKNVPGAEYPRFESIITHFEGLLARVLERCPVDATRGRDVTWIEVVYVNPIETNPAIDAHQSPERVLNLLAPPRPSTAGVMSEDFSLNRRFLLPERAGRLYVEAVSAVNMFDQRKILQLTLTARVAVDAFRTVREALDLAHVVIVRTFADITTSGYQEAWGRER